MHTCTRTYAHCSHSLQPVLTQDYLACIIGNNKSISVASYRTQGPATCVELPYPSAASQPLVHTRVSEGVSVSVSASVCL